MSPKQRARPGVGRDEGTGVMAKPPPEQFIDRRFLPGLIINAVRLAAKRTQDRLMSFADGDAVKPEDYRAVVQDIGAFGVFVQELEAAVRNEPMPPETLGPGGAG